MRSGLVRIGRRAFSRVSSVETTSSSAVPTASAYEDSSCLAEVHQVEGIWRAPRKLPYTKEEFDRAYPPSYKGMRIGLPESGTFQAKYIDPKYDEMSPIVWTNIFMAPILIWAAVETYYTYFPSEKKGHH